MRARPNELKLREKDVTRQVRDFLEWHGWRGYRNQVITSQNLAGGWVRAGEKGMADWLFVYYVQDYLPAMALVLWVEMKAEGEPLRPDQVRWQEIEMARGAWIITADKYESFCEWYEEKFGWLRTSDFKKGQGVLPLQDAGSL
jgi:hypothetical protein